MLRVAQNEAKENQIKQRGCGCKVIKKKIPRNITLLPPKTVAGTSIATLNTNSLRDNEKFRPCRCGTRERSKSSNEYVQKENMVGNNTSYNYKISSSVTSTADINLQDPKRASAQSTATKGLTEKRKGEISYDYILKQEIKGILEDKHSVNKSDFRPTVVVSSSNCTIDESIQSYQVFNSTMLTVGPEEKIRRHSYSSVADHENVQVPNAQRGRQGTYQIDPRVSKGKCVSKERSSNVQIYEDKKLGKSLNNQEQKKIRYETGPQPKNVDYPKNFTAITKISNVTARSKVSQDIISPIRPNCFTSKHTQISKIPEALRQPKIKKRAINRNDCQRINGPFVGDIYNEEYIEDVIKYIKIQEREITLRGKFLQNCNPDYKSRAKIVNWMLKEQENLNFSESEYYLAVNLFDHVLASVTVPLNMYQLVIITTIWIAMKLIGSGFIKASTVVKLCEGAYLTQQVLKMEQKVLRIMDSKVHTTEPTICVNYYLKLFRLQENHKLDTRSYFPPKSISNMFNWVYVRPRGGQFIVGISTPLAKLSAYYILDCFSLTPEFSSTPVSILAAASVKYTLTKYHDGEQQRINYLFRKLLSQEEIDKIKYVEAMINLQLMNMADKNYVFKEPYYKYGKKKGVLKVDQTINL